MRSACATENDAHPRRAGEFFSSLSSNALKDLQTMMSPVCFPAKTVLFQEQQAPDRVLILLEGSAKLSVNSRNGRRLILSIARPPELLGLASMVSGRCYELTAETLEPCRIAPIPGRTFFDFLMRHPAVYLGAARELALEMERTCYRLRIIGLSSSAAVKLARLLLEWSAGGRRTDRGTCVRVSLTHEELGECIGSTRETVSRAMADLRQRQLIAGDGPTLIVINRIALEAYARVIHGPEAGPRAAATSPNPPRSFGGARIHPQAAIEISLHTSQEPDARSGKDQSVIK